MGVGVIMSLVRNDHLQVYTLLVTLLRKAGVDPKAYIAYDPREDKIEMLNDFTHKVLSDAIDKTFHI